MKTRRTRLTLAAVGLTLAGFALAAPHGHRGDRHGSPGMGGFGPDPVFIVERLARHLDLDETQENRVSNILDAARPEFDALRDRGRSARENMKNLDPSDPDYSAALDNLAQESGDIMTEAALLFGRVRAEVHAVLTPEQVEELKAMTERWAERRRSRHGE